MTTGLAAVFVPLALYLTWVAGSWIAFTKADRAGWASLIPFYNFYVMLDVGDNDWWWLLLVFVPVVQFYALYKIGAGFARAFDKGVVYGIGLAYLPFIFFPLLAFSGAEYQGRSGDGVAPGA